MTELWNSRGLLYFFVWRDIKVRYKQTILGGLWAIIQPLLMMVTFSVFFGVLSKIPSGDVPYPLFSYVGILPWLLFSEGVARATNSLIYDANLIQKVYYPRMLSPMASIISPLLDFAVALVILAGMMVYFNHYPNFVILVLPLFLGLELLLTLGIGLWPSAINIQFRDMRYAVPLLIQLGLFASPVIYPISFVPERYHVLYATLNPMSAILEGFRWCLVGTEFPEYLGLSVCIILILLSSGVIYFHRKQKIFADVV